MSTTHPVRSLATAAAALSLTAVAAVGTAAPASASGRGVTHVDHSSNARCMGQAISAGAVTGGPRAVADHHHALKAALAQDGLSLGHVWRTVASLPSCE